MKHGYFLPELGTKSDMKWYYSVHSLTDTHTNNLMHKRATGKRILDLVEWMLIPGYKETKSQLNIWF